MSLTASIFQGLAVGLLLAALRAFGWDWEAAALLAGALVWCAPLFFVGRRARRSERGGPDPWPSSPILFAALPVVLPSLLMVWPFQSSIGFIDVHGAGDDGGVVFAMVVIALAAAQLIFLSGLTDWMYVRPHLRGGLGTVCKTSFQKRWRGVTRVWLLHRATATLGTIAALTGIATLAANTWVRPVDDIVAGAIAAVATVIAGYYITRTAPLLAIAINPPVQVGDVIEIAEEFNVHQPELLREYFVVDVALEGVKLLGIDASDRVRRVGLDKDRTHDRTVDVTDIAKLLRGRRAIRTPCPEGCQQLTEHCTCLRPWAPARDEGSRSPRLVDWVRHRLRRATVSADAHRPPEAAAE